MLHIKLFLIALLITTAAHGLERGHQDATATFARILNGGAARRATGFQVSLQIQRSATTVQHICGAVVISADFALTAAHCVNNRNKAQLSIQAGVTTLTSTLGSRHSILGYKVHEDYQVGSINNIAIIKVSPAFVLGDSLVSIGFTSTTVVGSDVSVLLSGWGALDATGLLYPTRLQMLSATTITNDRCRQFYSQVTATEICTFRSVFRGACTGDAGGPLTNDAGTVLIGIISYGPQLCGNGRPDVHTRISSFTNWITTKMAETWT